VPRKTTYYKGAHFDWLAGLIWLYQLRLLSLCKRVELLHYCQTMVSSTYTCTIGTPVYLCIHPTTKIIVLFLGRTVDTPYPSRNPLEKLRPFFRTKNNMALQRDGWPSSNAAAVV
jgi:hypothetical protein